MSSVKVEVKTKPLDPEVKFVLKIRVYGEGHRTHDSHGYLLDDMPMGVSAPVTEIVVNIRKFPRASRGSQSASSSTSSTDARTVAATATASVDGERMARWQ